MKNNRGNFKKLFDIFLDICKENDIWYAVDGTTLLGVVRHSGFVPWDEKIQVMMTSESFNKLKRIATSNVIDSSSAKIKKKLSSFFVMDSSDLVSTQAFIEIRVLIPTTVKKIKKFKSFKYLLNSKISNKKINTKTSITYLKEARFEGFWLLSNRKQKIISSWIQVLSFNTTELQFIDLKVNVPIEYDSILKTWHGENYMKAKVPHKILNYLSPLKWTKENI